MARSIPQVRNGRLHYPPGTAGISIGTAEWYDWLENHRSFVGTQTIDVATLQNRLETMASLLHEARRRLPADQNSLHELRMQGEISALSTFVSCFRGEYLS